MRITVTRSGGFGGLRPEVSEVATEALDRQDAAPLEALAASLPDRADPPSGADQYQYDVTVEHQGQTRSYQFHGQQNPAADLIARVRAIAQRRPS